MKEVFSGERLVLAGEKHGTVGVVTGGGVVEITTFRTEGDYKDSRHPQWVRFVSRIEEDLSRRDFTVNAMAYSPKTGLCDPFGGEADLKNRILRAVGDPRLRFREDALRILRGARFSARFRLTPEAETEAAMLELAPLLDLLAKERVFEELCKLLLWAQAEDLLRWEKLLTRVIPEMAVMVGYEQHSRHHAHDLYTHTALTVAAVPPELTLRWAALLHDVGKPDTFSQDDAGEGHYYGHAARSAVMADEILRRLKAPNQLREQVSLLIEKHMAPPEAERKFLRRWLSRYGEPMLSMLLKLQRADVIATGTRADTALFDRAEEIVAALAAEDACLSLKDLAVNGRDLMALGMTGRQIGLCLNHLLELVLEEKCPNEKQALLSAAQSL
jgi:tRNA nucleotidyltransferase (CCA-adding enzyme)